MISKKSAVERRKKLDKSALNGEPIPEGLTMPEQLYYLTVRRLYADWKEHRLTDEQARTDKRTAEAAYLEAVFLYAKWLHYVAIRDAFCHEFHRDGTACRKPAECRLYRVIAGVAGGDQI